MNHLQRILPIALLGGISSCVEGANPPEYGLLQVYALAAQTSGNAIGTSSTGAVVRSPGTRFAFFRTALAGPDNIPTFANGSLPPACFGFTITPTVPPGLNPPDAGTIAFEGVGMPPIADPGTGMVVPALPNPLECNRVMPPGLEADLYSCAPAPTLGVIVDPLGDVIGDNTEITVRASGGSEVGGFESGPIAAPDVLEPTPAFESVMLNFNPKDPIVAEWDPTSDGDLAVVEIIGRLADNSRAAQILCLEPMASGRVEIPRAALNLIPESPGFDNALIIITSLIAVNVDRNDSAGWGGYLTGSGRGTTNFACRAASASLNINCAAL